MNLLGVKSVIRRKKSKYKKSTTEATAENLLGRDFNASKPNEKWATDVTEFKIIEMKQKMYLSAIIDLYDRSIVSYVISKRNDNHLVFETFEKAMESNPDGPHYCIQIEVSSMRARYLSGNLKKEESYKAHQE